MSKKNRDRQSTPLPYAAPPAPVTYTTTLKPQRKALVILSIIFALWVAVLLTLYFTTIYPTRH